MAVSKGLSEQLIWTHEVCLKRWSYSQHAFVMYPLQDLFCTFFGKKGCTTFSHHAQHIGYSLAAYGVTLQ